MAENIDKKIEKIEKSCYEIAKKELKELEEENNINISKKKSLMLEEYKDELSIKYNDDISQIERDYNKSIFDYEMLEKVKLKVYKEEKIYSIYSKVLEQLKNYVFSLDYEKFLLHNISNLLSKYKAEDCIIYLTENDFNKFGKKIQEKFNCRIEKIENEYIGGCIIVNELEKISIDNTLKTNIQDEIKKINF